MICRQCGREFEPKKRGRKNTGFCCPRCYNQWRSHNICVLLPPKYKKTCQQCGNEFETNSKKQKFCSVKCSREARKGRTVYRKVCPHCGVEFETIYPKQEFCSSTCGSRYYGQKRRGKYFCEYCGEPRWSDHPNRNRFCSPECARKAAAVKMLPIKLARQAEWEERHNKVCPRCGGAFIANRSYRIYCCDECQYETALETQRQQFAEAYEPRTFYCAECGTKVTTTCGDHRSLYCSDVCAQRAAHREYKATRKEQMAAAFVEPVGLRGVYERANGICEICGLPVPNDTSPENPWGATRDHIVPLSKGGLHEKSNCQLAHRICNSMKQDALDEFKIDWNQKLIEEPGRWNEPLDELWEQLGMT